MADLLADENFPLPVVLELRKLGHDVKAWHETGLANIGYPDRLVLERAAREKRTLLTNNRKHFVRLHEDIETHEGIIVCTEDLDFTGLAERIDQSIQAHAPLQGKLLRINRPS